MKNNIAIEMLSSEKIAEIIKRGVTYSPQTDQVVIHGAIDEIRKAHVKAVDQLDEQFNKLVEVCNALSQAAAGHDLGELNRWIDRYTNEDFTINWRKILES